MGRCREHGSDEAENGDRSRRHCAETAGNDRIARPSESADEREGIARHRTIDRPGSPAKEDHRRTGKAQNTAKNVPALQPLAGQ